MDKDFSDEVLQWASDVETEVGHGATHFDFSSNYRKYFESLQEGDPRRQVAKYEVLIFDLFLPHAGETKDRFGSLAPAITTSGSTYPPPVANFPEDAVEYYRRRQPTLSISTARARYADFMWLRTGDHEQGSMAIAAYQEAAKELGRDDVSGLVRVEYLHRAVELARTLNAISNDLREQLMITAEELIVATGPGFLCYLIEFAGDLLATEKDRCLRLCDRILEKAKHHALVGGAERHVERSLLGAVAHLNQHLGLAGDAVALLHDAARSIEHEADERHMDGALVRAALLQDALGNYAKLGMSADIKRAKLRLNEASRDAEKEFKSIKVEQPVSREEIERGLDTLLATASEMGAPPDIVLLSIHSGIWPDWSEIETQTDFQRREFPLLYLFKNVQIGPDGQPMPRPNDGTENQKLYDEAGIYRLRVQIALQLTAIRISILRERGLWDANRLIQVISESPLFERTIPLLRAGIEDFENDRGWSAVHVLLPLIERGLRELGRNLGYDVLRLERETERLRYASLDLIMEHEPLRQFLNEIQPSVALELELLLTHPYGFNLRNNIAHGVVDPASEPYGLALIAVLILLLLSVVTRKGTLETEEDSDTDTAIEL